ncbi:MAG: hypothetical protein JWR16_1448 [Nevskia sp.]|nr:hypothetical protein [Nevskia sp.]
MEISSLHSENWLSFFSSTAQVSGGLVGLVFVAMTLKPELLGAAGDVGMRTLARQTFADFLNVLLVSLLMQVPYSATQIGGFLAVVGIVGGHRVLRGVIAVVRAAPTPHSRGPVMQRLILSLLGNAALLIAGALLLLGTTRVDIFWTLLFTGMITLILSGSRSAWLLVTHGA